MDQLSFFTLYVLRFTLFFPLQHFQDQPRRPLCRPSRTEAAAHLTQPFLSEPIGLRIFKQLPGLGSNTRGRDLRLDQLRYDAPLGD